MAWYSPVSNFFSRPSGANVNNISVPYYQNTRDELNQHMGQGGPYQQKSSYTGGWNDLISRIGSGPSVAAMQYQNAVQQGQAGVASMARGSVRPGMAREALNRQADMTQGLAQGSSMAAAQEQESRNQQMNSALQNATMAENRVNEANQNAWQNLLMRRQQLDSDQYQAILERERIRQQQAALPTGFERVMGMAGKVGEMYMATQTGNPAAIAGAMSKPGYANGRPTVY